MTECSLTSTVHAQLSLCVTGFNYYSAVGPSRLKPANSHAVRSRRPMSCPLSAASVPDRGSYHVLERARLRAMEKLHRVRR